VHSTCFIGVDGGKYSFNSVSSCWVHGFSEQAHDGKPVYGALVTKGFFKYLQLKLFEKYSILIESLQ
jgi:hypothetical protein